jgi:hypothetical protein
MGPQKARDFNLKYMNTEEPHTHTVMGFLQLLTLAVGHMLLGTNHCRGYLEV